MPNDTATEKTAPAKNRDNAIASGDHRSGFPTSLMIGRVIRPLKHRIDLACHDKIVFVQSLDLFGAQRDRRIIPAKADIRMMALGFRQFAHVTNKAKCFLKIAETEGSFDTVATVVQFLIRSLHLKPLCCLTCQRRNASAARGAILLGKCLGHVGAAHCAVNL